MKIQTTKSFDDLMKRYYGVPAGPQLSNTARVEALLTDYYGRPFKRKKKCPPPSGISLSLSQDDGELLPQQVQETQFEEYVVAKSVVDEQFEEYVVARSCPTEERPVAVAASLNLESFEPVNVAQEYEVDVLEPLRPEPYSAARSLPPAPASAPYYPSEPARAYEQSTARPYTPTPQEEEAAKPSEDDFISDMKSILMGKSVFDPNTGKTVEKDSFAREQSPDARSNDRNFPDADKSQAIFDRLAQSMQYANAYDLGTVELENRFADFDRVSDLQQKAKGTKKAKKEEPRANGSTTAATPATGETAKVDSEDFIRDMDAIQSARNETTNRNETAAPAPVPPAESLSAVLSMPSRDGEVDPACIPFALSLSVTDNPADYSRPLYDTGEHVLSGWDLYTDQLRVGKAPGLMFSYGQLIAMADLYESVDQMMNAAVTELKTLKALIELSAAYYRGKMKGRPDSSMDVSNERWEEATRKRYLKLAEDNFEHFSPAPAFKSLPHITTIKGNNKSAWERHHRSAIHAAQQIFLDPDNANRSVFLEWPLIINAFGDHYLTDAFASGHLINKEATIAYFKAKFFTGSSLNKDANTFFDKVAEKAWSGRVKTEFSKLETEDWKGFPGVHPDIDRASRFASVLKAVAGQEPDQIGNLAVKALHDRLNKDGIAVTNNAGSGTWTLYGDGMMDAKSLDIIKKAVQQSVDNINDPAIRASNLNFDDYFGKVWRYIPKLTSSSFVTVERLSGEYTNPKSQVLIDAAAKIIADQVDLLVAKLLEAKALRRNTAGWVPNVL